VTPIFRTWCICPEFFIRHAPTGDGAVIGGSLQLRLTFLLEEMQRSFLPLTAVKD